MLHTEVILASIATVLRTRQCKEAFFASVGQCGWSFPSIFWLYAVKIAVIMFGLILLVILSPIPSLWCRPALNWGQHGTSFQGQGPVVCLCRIEELAWNHPETHITRSYLLVRIIELGSIRILSSGNVMLSAGIVFTSLHSSWSSPAGKSKSKAPEGTCSYN